MPPFDPSLPCLDLALTPVSAGEILAESLLNPGYELVGCRPCYLRYKPGQSCLVLYRLRLRDPEGRPLEGIAHARLYGDERAERIWSRRRIQPLAERIESAALRPAAHLSALGAIAQVYPIDVDLPVLTRLGSLRLVRYKPARKALLHDIGRAYVKVYADDRGERAYEAGRLLGAAGVPVVEPLRYSKRLRVLVHPDLPGEPLSSLRGDEAYEEAVGEAGLALRGLHSALLARLPRYNWRGDLSAAAWAVSVACPTLRRRARRLADRLSGLLEARARTSVSSHGDFYDDQLLVSPNGVVVLDLDRVVGADPTLDLGTFLAHLSVQGGMEPARDAFVSGYEQAPSGRALAMAEAAALLKLSVAPFRSLELDWPEEVERRLLLAEQRLVEATPRIRAGLDEALPQLEELLNRDAAGRVLTELYGEPVEIRDATLVRHRPGRRCTIRYDLFVAGRTECVYAKTYADGKGPRVHAVLEAISSAEACGSAFSAPKLVGCVRRLNLVVQRAVAGEPVTPRLLAGDAVLAEQIAAALHKLHSSRIELPRTHELDDELAIVSGRVTELPPHLTHRARQCLASAASQAKSRTWRLCSIHRDLYQEQVLIDGGRIAFLDLDDAARSEPAVDVANFLGHLRLLGLDEPLAAQALDVVATAFASAYSSLDADLDLRLVRLLEATTLLRLACIHFPRGGERLAEQLIVSGATLVEEAA